jgi:hypothetical protein
VKRVDVVYALIYDEITEKVLMVNNQHSTWSLPGGAVAFGVGKYTTSNEIKKVMIGLLRSIKATFEVLEKHLP